MPEMGVTQLLRAWNAGDPTAFPRLVPLVYEELRRVAANQLHEERPDHTLQPTALVHEAYMRLVDVHSPSWQSRVHFFGAAAELMRVEGAHQRVDHLTHDLNNKLQRLPGEIVDILHKTGVLKG